MSGLIRIEGARRETLVYVCTVATVRSASCIGAIVYNVNRGEEGMPPYLRHRQGT